MKRFKPGRVALLALLFAGKSVAGPPVEQRCSEIGDDCFCSEPLNFSSSGNLVFNGNFFDPPDSEGPGAKECNGGTQAIFKSGGSARTIPGNSMGLPDVENVFQFHLDVSGNRGNIRSYSHSEFTNGTYCQRAYQRYENAGMEPAVYGDDDVKGMDSDDCSNGTQPCAFLAFNWFPGSLRLFGSKATTGSNGTPFNLNPNKGTQIQPVGGATVTFDKCVSGWCRLELCYDHNLDGDNKMHYRGRVVALVDGTTQTWGPEKSVGGNARAVTGGRSFPSQFMCDRGSPPHDNQCNGRNRWFTHIMTAKTSRADASFWIGPAYEIEGGGTQLPPPTPSPPAAPFLLD